MGGISGFNHGGYGKGNACAPSNKKTNKSHKTKSHKTKTKATKSKKSHSTKGGW